MLGNGGSLILYKGGGGLREMREVEGNRRELRNCPCYRGAQTYHQIKGNSNPLQMLEGKYILFIFSLDKNIIRGDASLWVGGRDL